MASNEVDGESITLADLLSLDCPDSPKAKTSKKKKKKIYRFYSEEQVQQALHEIDNGILSLRKAAMKYNVPRSTLVFRRSPRFTKIEKGPRPILSKEEEDQLVKWILTGEKYGAPRRYSHIQEWVQKLLNDHPRNNVPFPDNKPQRGWMKTFMRRHPELGAMKNMSFDDHCEIIRAAVKTKAAEDFSVRPIKIIRRCVGESEHAVQTSNIKALQKTIRRTRVSINGKKPKSVEVALVARANVKKVASEDVSTKPADIISQSIAHELVDPKDVASLRRAIYRTRVACQEKNPLEPSTSALEIAEPLTADALIEGEFSQVLPKLEVIDPEYEQEPGPSRYFSVGAEDYSSRPQDIAYESQDSGKATEPITARDLNILSEPAGEEQDFDNDEESAEPSDKRIKVETYEYHDLDYPGETSTSIGRAGSSQSSASFEPKQVVASSYQLPDDVEFTPQAVVASPVKRSQNDPPPGPNRKPVAQVVQRRDRSDIFGEYVAAKLRSLKTDAARNRVECLIANILFEASRGKFDDSDSTSDITAELQSFISSTKDLQTLKSESHADSCIHAERTADEVGSCTIVKRTADEVAS